MENLRKILFFTDDSVVSGVVVDGDGRTIYTAETSTKHRYSRTVTELKCTHGDFVAKLEWRDACVIKISFGSGGQKTMPRVIQVRQQPRRKNVVPTQCWLF